MNITNLDSKKCVGCFACKEICPVNSVELVQKELGFLYPSVDTNKCIGCGLCYNSCQIDKSLSFHTNKKCFSYVSNAEDSLNNSSSGGAFYDIAFIFLKDGGVVYGSSYCFDGKTRHVRIDNIDDLKDIQGSKYIKSDISMIFNKIEGDLKEGLDVLLSGTPCQIQAIKLFLKKDYKNLYTIDIVCHGVPSQLFFDEYLKNEEKVFHKKIKTIFFRKKNNYTIYNRCRFNETIVFTDDSVIVRPYFKSSYYYFFLNKANYRESCYNCSFACQDRIGDLTLGDFWGITRLNPINNLDYGCSLISVNSEKGKMLISRLPGLLKEEDYKVATSHNEQLNKPSQEPNTRASLVKMFSEDYVSINNFYRKKFRFKRFLGTMKLHVPRFIKRFRNNG